MIFTKFKYSIHVSFIYYLGATAPSKKKKFAQVTGWYGIQAEGV